ncbi:MAG: hypothetical protein J6U54_12095 [Clostridiales bacterium]|nr:hypothetical protein [Clostridiales bacterium]
MSYRSEHIKRVSLNNDDFTIAFWSRYTYAGYISIPLRFTEKGKKKLRSNGLPIPIERVYLTNEQRENMTYLLRSIIPDSKILLISKVFEKPYEIDPILLRNLWNKDKINILSLVINCYPLETPYNNGNMSWTKAYLETLVVKPKR